MLRCVLCFKNKSKYPRSQWMEHRTLFIFSFFVWGVGGRIFSINKSSDITKMAQQHKVSGFDDLVDCINRLKSDNKPINVFFTGSKDDTGKSWCPDCVEAQPFLDKALTSSDPNTHFIYCDVGDRPFWKDMKNVFRLDRNTHLSVIPTLIRWNGPQRLEGEQLLNADLLSMFFSEE